MKYVQFVDDALHQSSSAAITVNVISPTTLDVNLCHTPNICDYIQRKYVKSKADPTHRCIGYLESPQMYKHLFYLTEKDRVLGRKATASQSTTVRSMSDLLKLDVDEVLGVVDQLQLAHKTAMAVLQYHETPWLSDRWRLQDLSYFGSKTNLDETAMRTLHLSSQIATPNKPDQTTDMDGVESSAKSVSEEVRCGINNVTLFFLGVALLEIAHWAPIEKKMTPRDELNETYTARRLAKGRAPLGPHYQKIAEKCLQCNFGFGTELNSNGLQTAVYNDVVCELESMIKELTL